VSRRRAKPADAKKAVAYVRMSTDRQDLSPDAQRAAISRWASAQGVAVVAWHDDLGVSGGTPLEERPGLLAAIEAIDANGARETY
jgi:DNA invertase Pin-like site-specific DNA recombinase